MNSFKDKFDVVKETHIISWVSITKMADVGLDTRSLFTYHLALSIKEEYS